MNVLLDTNVLAEPLRELPDPVVMAQLESEEHVLHTASVVIHELSYGIHRLPSGRKQQRLNSYLQGLLRSASPCCLTALRLLCGMASRAPISRGTMPLRSSWMFSITLS